MTWAQLQQACIARLETVYEPREGRNIAALLLAHYSGYSASQMAVYKMEAAPAPAAAAVERAMERLLLQEPVQYVLGSAWFYGLELYVSPDVLIPRPETEELVERVLQLAGQRQIPQPAVLDVGTGSGCIPVALAKHLPDAAVWAVDLSAGALAVAAKNAQRHGVTVHFQQLDFTDTPSWAALPQFDIIVSNPPYIPLAGKKDMLPNVLEFEPHTALFVPDERPLLFYELLARFGQTHLLPGGFMACEIHEDLGAAVKAVFEGAGYASVQVHEDMQGKERMVTAKTLEFYF